jgi:hypothetical protein
MPTGRTTKKATSGRLAVAAALTCALLASCAAAGAAQAAPPSRPHAGANPRARPAGVITPRPHAVLPARPLTIRLRVRLRARRLRATLNGHSILPHLSRRHRGVRSLIASPNYGLRYGPNVLRVSARRGGKGPRRTRTVRFRVRADRPLAAAGIDRVAAAGDRLRLVGTKSKLHPSARRRGARLRYRWSIVRAPGGRRGAAASAAKLRHPTSPTPVVIPGATGAFTLQLTVTAPDGEVGSDLVNVRADPPPSVWLETGAKQGNQYGVRLSGPISAFYPGDTTKWLQIVVLKRSNLELVSNKSYDCPQATEHPFEDEEEARFVAPCVGQVRGDLAKLKDPDHSYLAIVVNQPGSILKQEPVGVMAALGEYVPQWEWWRSKGDFVNRGTFSAVFVPGLPELNTVHPAADSELKSEPPAMINDTLVRDNEGNYSLSPSERIEYDLHAPGTDGGQNVIAVGAKRFVEQINGYGGFQVVVLDARTLQGKSAWFGSGKSELEAMAEMLRKATAIALNIRNPTQLVFIASHGDPSADVTDFVLPPLQNTLANEISRVGGTRGRFFAALNDRLPEHHSYALVGLGSEASGFGNEVLGPLSEGEGASQAPLRGILGRTGDYYQWRVQSTGPPGLGTDPNRTAAATQLLDTVGQAPSQWPEQGNAGRTAAVKFIGMKVFGTDAPRTQYWTLPLPFQASKWEKFSGEIKALEYPIGGQFSQEDFSWAQDELRQEIGWLITTHQYLEALAEPYSTTAWTSWAAFEKVADKIKEDVGLGSDEKYAVAEAEALAGFRYAVSIGESIPVVGSAIKLAEATYEFAATEVRVDGESAADPFRVKVADTAEQLVKRLEAIQTLLRRQVPDAIASDYARLKTVGVCGAASVRERAGCPWNAEAWQLTQDDQEAVGKALLQTSRVAAYSALLPVKYTAWRLPVSHYRKASFYAGYNLKGCRYPFENLPATGQFVRPIYALAAEPAVQVTALGYLTGRGEFGDAEWKMHVPAASVTDELFGTGNGDLQVDAEEFFGRSFRLKEEALAHYPEQDSETGWLQRCYASALSGRLLSAPPRASLGAAAHKGIPVSFDVPREGSTVRLTLSLGTADPRRSAKPGAAMRDGSVLAELTQRNRSAGNYSAGIRITRALARRVRRTKFRRATLRLTVFGQHGRKSAAKSSLVLLP